MASTFSVGELSCNECVGEKQYPPREKGKRDSGILYYFENGEKDTLWPKSIECQVQEGDCGDTWCVGTMVESSNKSDTEWGMKRIFRSENFENPTGEWNTMEILCNGSQTEHYVNGHLVNTGAKTSVAKGKILLQARREAPAAPRMTFISLTTFPTISMEIFSG